MPPTRERLRTWSHPPLHHLPNTIFLLWFGSYSTRIYKRMVPGGSVAVCSSIKFTSHRKILDFCAVPKSVTFSLGNLDLQGSAGVQISTAIRLIISGKRRWHGPIINTVQSWMCIECIIVTIVILSAAVVGNMVTGRQYIRASFRTRFHARFHAIIEVVNCRSWDFDSTWHGLKYLKAGAFNIYKETNQLSCQACPEWAGATLNLTASKISAIWRIFVEIISHITHSYCHVKHLAVAVVVMMGVYSEWSLLQEHPYDHAKDTCILLTNTVLHLYRIENSRCKMQDR